MPYCFSLAGLTRTTIEVSSVPGMANAEFSTVIQSDTEIVADRTMTWDVGSYGGHADTSILAPTTTWYLAEGATHGGFDLFYLIQNAPPPQNLWVGDQ